MVLLVQVQNIWRQTARRPAFLGLPMRQSTASDTCSGATFSWPEMWYCTSSLKKVSVLVCQQIVKPDTAADEDLFHPGQLPELPQQGHIVAVVGV